LTRNRTLLVAISILSLSSIHANGQRTTVSLNGTWQIEESVGADDVPQSFSRRVPVPGLAHSAIPFFPDVDQFDSREYINNLIGMSRTPAERRLPETVIGVTRQKRNYFWYQTAFKVPQRKDVVLLKINKAQFGTAVWLNGKKLGEHPGCFTAGYFNITDALYWESENNLIVRIGAHPNALPLTIPTGIDSEKTKWTPGIYDDVSLLLCDNPVIESVQVAPRFGSSEILVQTTDKNYGSATQSLTVTQQVKTWKGSRRVGERATQRLSLGAGEEKTVTKTVRVPNATLWTPENPFLYVVGTSTGRDNTTTRFGMRELRFDTATRKAYLNGKIYYLRGSNITLHRFFEDENSGQLPWNEQCVRKLLIDIPKRLHWNSFRFCIGPVPDRWLDIADEAGLLIQNEFFIWGYRERWNTAEVIKQFTEWMRDNWNHPSVIIWDASNETTADIIGDTIIPAVRPLDLSNRLWDNGYNFPVGANDPIEDHPYHIVQADIATKDYTIFEDMTGSMSDNWPHPSAHAVIANEYGWLWVNRDGTPTWLTQRVWRKLAPGASARELIERNAYIVAALTEFFRANRGYAGVQHFVYLTGSFPDAFTAYNFEDVVNLKLHPPFEDYMKEAFNPLGVYLHLWHQTLAAGSEKNFGVMMINDEYETRRGKVETLA